MADNLIVSNNGVATIDGGLSSTATTLVLNDISLMPILTNVDDYCILTLIRESDGSIEYVRCTSQDAGARSYEVIRGVEDTTPLVFLEGDEVRNLLTKGQIDGFLKEPDAFNNYLNGLNVDGGTSLFTGDANDIFENSRYLCTSNTPNAPITGFGHLTTMVNTSKQFGSQFWLPNDGTTPMYIRSTDGSLNWGVWREVAEVNKTVPISGNANNPMTGNLIGSNVTRIEDFRELRLGKYTDLSTFIDFRSSSDPSQSAYSARIIRNSGVNGALDIANLGTSEIHIDSGGDIKLDAGSGLINADNNSIKNVANPTASQDAATKAYVDSIGGYGALLASVSLASGSGSKFIAWNNAWDSYDFIQLVVNGYTGTLLGAGLGLGLWDGSSWEGISNSESQSGQEIFFSPTLNGVTSPTSKSSFVYEMGLGSVRLVPVLQRSAPGSVPTSQVFSRQGYLKQASHTNAVVATDYASWDISSGLSGKSWGIDLDNGNYTGGTFNLYGFNYPT